jgi:hypothetical protein
MDKTGKIPPREIPLEIGRRKKEVQTHDHEGWHTCGVSPPFIIYRHQRQVSTVLEVDCGPWANSVQIVKQLILLSVQTVSMNIFILREMSDQFRICFDLDEICRDD